MEKEKESELKTTEMSDMTLSAFLEKLASEEPVPGGGSVAALSGALGAALIAMYCRIGVHQNNLAKDAEVILQNGITKAIQLQTELTRMITLDSLAYGEVMAAFKLPKSSDDEKKLRQAAIQDAFKKAVEAPLQTLRMSIECVSLIPQMGPHGNSSAFSDLKVAQYLCQAGAKSALENIEVNLPYIKDGKFLTRIGEAVTALRGSLEQAISQKIEKPS